MNREYIIEHFEDAKVLDPEKIQFYPFHRNNVEKSWEYKVGIGVGCFGNFKYEYLISVQDDEKIALKCRKDSSKWMSYKEFMKNIKITQHMKTTFQQKIFETIVWMINEKMIIFPRIQMINDKINYYIGTNDSGYDMWKELEGEYKDELRGSD